MGWGGEGGQEGGGGIGQSLIGQQSLTVQFNRLQFTLDPTVITRHWPVDRSGSFDGLILSASPLEPVLRPGISFKAL